MAEHKKNLHNGGKQAEHGKAHEKNAHHKAGHDEHAKHGKQAHHEEHNEHDKHDKHEKNNNGW